MSKHRHPRTTSTVVEEKPIRISLLIEHDAGEVLVSEQRYHIHATGATKDEALEAFWRVFYGYEDVLADDFEHLGGHLKEQLQYIREVKAWEERLREAKQKQLTEVRP